MFKAMPRWLKAIMIILIVIALVADCWYIIIKKTAPGKEIDYTFVVNELNNVELESERNVVNVKYYANNDNSGVEMLEVKFNYFITDQSDDVYSAGIQYIGTKNNPIKFWNWTYDSEGVFDNKQYTQTKTESDVYKYNTHDEQSYTATSELDNQTSMLITIDNNYYKLKFKGKQTTEPYYTYNGVLLDEAHYMDYDLNYFSALMLKALKSMPYGTDSVQLFKFDNDFFEYYKKVGDNTFEKIETGTSELSLIKTRIENYFYIRIQTFQTGAKNADDSLFGCIQGQFNYGQGGVIDANQFSAQVLVSLNEYDFDYYKVEFNKYELKLNSKAIEKLNQYENFLIEISLNFDVFDDAGINVVGFCEDSGLNEYHVYSIKGYRNGSLLEVLPWN